MNASLTLIIVMAVLYAAGVYVMLERSLTRVLIGFMLLGNATNVLLFLMAGRPGLAPILGEGVDEAAISDPLPQALMLTAIVINLGIVAFMLALIYRSWWLAQLGDAGDLIDDAADAEEGARAKEALARADADERAFRDIIRRSDEGDGRADDASERRGRRSASRDTAEHGRRRDAAERGGSGHGGPDRDPSRRDGEER